MERIDSMETRKGERKYECASMGSSGRLYWRHFSLDEKDEQILNMR